MAEYLEKWVSCEDDMPNYKQEVLVQLKDETMLNAVFFISDKGTCCCFKTVLGWLQYPQVVAWQPKPEPYKKAIKKQKRGAENG